MGAAHRLARHLARVRALAAGESEPSPLFYQHALRDVIGRCLYGVDINPMAAELCRVSLWLEALEPGKPLSFLDHHIRVGNSLLGTMPGLIAAGIPDDAFTAIEGDDKKVCSALKKRNKQERKGQRDMLHLMVREPGAEYNTLESRTSNIDEAPDDTIDEVRRKADQFHGLVVSPDYRHAQQVADAWCAAFVWEKQANAPFEPITTDTIRRLEADPNALTPAQYREVELLSRQYQFFHWHLAFPEVFAKGGFDCVLGNPPWERVKVQEKEWFAARHPDIASAHNAAARRKAIAALAVDTPELYFEWLKTVRETDATAHFIRNSNRYPLTGSGDINTYALFVETTRTLTGPYGYAGCIVPSGVATDDTTKHLFSAVVSNHSLVSLYDFENTQQLFPDIASIQKFCLVTFHGTRLQSFNADFVFFETDPSELKNADRHFSLSPEEFRLLSPNTGTCPAFRSRRDAELTLACCRRHTVLVDSSQFEELNPWGLHFLRMFDMASASGLFVTQAELERDCFVRAGTRYVKDNDCFVPLYEPKMFHQYHHRHGTFEGVTRDSLFSTKAPTVKPGPCQLASPVFGVMSRYWVNITSVRELVSSRTWLLAYRAITQSMTNQRCMVAAVLPLAAVNHNAPCIMLSNRGSEEHLTFLGVLNSFVFDYLLRQRLNSAFISFFILRQVPFPRPEVFGARCEWGGQATLGDWTYTRTLELSYNAYDLEALANETGCNQPPFRWDEERRFLLRCELDAAFFHLYLPAEANGDPASPGGSGGASWRQAEGETAEDLARLKASFPTPRDAVAYIMDTFPIVRRKDEKKYDGDYRAKRVILEIYDAMSDAMRTGHPYQTRLDPPPADPRCCHSLRTE